MSSSYKCLVVEDEPLAQNVLKNYIALSPSLELVAVCNDSFEAQPILNLSKVDILFLDINLPKMSGINLLKTLPVKPATIFTTAYPEFAVEGFELDAIDYLLKPFSLERFYKAVNKAIDHIRALSQATIKAPTNDYISLKADKKIFRVPVNVILYMEALGDYVKVTTRENNHVVNYTLRDLLNELPERKFLRVHKSFAIAKDKITFLEGNYIRIEGKDIPVGATYREIVNNELK